MRRRPLRTTCTHARPRTGSIVLVVEDEALIRLFIRGALEDGGYAAAEAQTADEALDLLQNDSHAAVVTDIEMPGALSGLDLAWIVETRWPEIGIVLTSGRTLPSPEEIPSGARFITKPCQTELLLQAVEEVTKT